MMVDFITISWYVLEATKAILPNLNNIYIKWRQKVWGWGKGHGLLVCIENTWLWQVTCALAWLLALGFTLFHQAQKFALPLKLLFLESKLDIKH